MAILVSGNSDRGVEEVLPDVFSVVVVSCDTVWVTKLKKKTLKEISERGLERDVYCKQNKREKMSTNFHCDLEINCFLKNKLS